MQPYNQVQQQQEQRQLQREQRCRRHTSRG
jgi:hypothetical protein